MRFDQTLANLLIYSSQDDYSRLAQTALDQINNRLYVTELQNKGIKDIFKYGVAFSGKNVEICSE